MAAATWRWNTDQDDRALRLFDQVVTRFPGSPQAPDALYAIGRIAQEAGRYAEARTSYMRVAERYPNADVAPEARWRAGWVRYLAGDMGRAEQTFAGIAARSARRARVAGEYWRARALERLGRKREAQEQLAHVAEHHPTSYYAGLADERLGRNAAATPPPPADAGAATFPANLPGAHAERARLLAGLGFRHFARLELDAVDRSSAPRRELLQAYHAVGAVDVALRLAHAMRPRTGGPFREYLYPLGYWDTVRPAADARGIDPLLVLAVIRQESLFDPEALSPAGARGLMQLMPVTARRIGGDAAALRLEDPSNNVRLGVALLAQLIDHYGGSLVKALAAYNGGEDAVAKWEHRYAGRQPDEFVELISFRETRDYVKAVLRNHRVYRRLYAAPTASATSAGSPPKAPFDMITMTSPGRAVETR
jgi:soluble lytic murein transglycosylase